MPRLVELKYNPYIPQVQILIDGNQIPEFSRLIQYTDEDIWLWITKFMDTLYSEIRDEYFISFIGTRQDAVILRFVCEQDEHCVGFRHTEFSVDDGLATRMRKLNQLIKKTGTTVFEKSIIDANFFVASSFQQFLEEIISLDINNLFCTVRISSIGANFQYDDNEKSVLFLLVCSVEEGKKKLQRPNVEKPAFVLIIGPEKKVLDVTNRGWFIQTTEELLFETIFDCFLQMPLVIAFRNCVRSIKGGNKVSKELRLITGIEPLVNIIVSSEIEVGKSNRISVALEPEVGNRPQLIFHISNSQIASCDGMSVCGLKEGICTLEVYRKGGKQPFFTKDIKIFKRNRITKLLLADDSIVLGMNDRKKMKLDYYPSDADNVASIIWKSSNENIARIDSTGSIVAAGIGSCRLICIAENVSAQCICTVKPYLSDIETNLQLDENNTLSMFPLQEISVVVNCIPNDCIDGVVTLESSDTNIVNVVKNTLYAKNIGSATVRIKNSTMRIQRSFSVMVNKKELEKKKSFFKSLFKSFK